MNTPPHIIVVGTTSSGKSTLAARLAGKLGADFIDLDALHWEPNWVEAPDEVFRRRVELATLAGAWVVAGNYHVVRDLLWKKADTIIWLDYPFPIVFWRLLTRTIRRAVTREKLFSDNVENFWTHMKIWSNESLFRWLFKTYWRRKREYPALFALPENSHLNIIRFDHPARAKEWLKKITA
ncbi:MAG: adenylate kinase [Chloroflexi bacterium]|nr:adenylate kinase [Chloroflexota bacterium]